MQNKLNKKSSLNTSPRPVFFSVKILYYGCFDENWVTANMIALTAPLGTDTQVSQISQ